MKIRSTTCLKPVGHGKDIVYSFMRIKVARKIDIGEIMLQVEESDLAALQKVLTEGGFEPPAIKISIYKNRGNRWKNILLWCRADLGTCRIEPMFVTNYRFELIKIDDLRITVAADNEISFESEHA